MKFSLHDYHHQTSYRRHNMSGHTLDWKNQPDLYKTYPETGLQRLPQPVSDYKETLSEILRKPPERRIRNQLSIDSVSQILFTAYRITAQTPYRSGFYSYRSVPSAGALYPFEVYFSSHSVSGLDDGLYHYDIRSHSVFQIRRGSLLTLSHPDHPSSELTIFISSIFFRSSWKYRDRSYRYNLVDAGHLLENFILTLKAASLPYRAHLDFDDAAINDLLGLDTNREVCLAILKCSDHPELHLPDAANLEKLPESYRDASRVAGCETVYPLVTNIHHLSSVRLSHDLPSIRMADRIGVTPDGSIDIQGTGTHPEIMSFSEAVQRRRSLRNFIPSEITSDQWKTLLGYLIPSGDQSEDQRLFSASICTGCIAVRAQGLKPGCYCLNPDTGTIGLYHPGDWGNITAHVCLGQEWIANAGLNIFFAVNLKALEEAFGARGYRYAMINAGRLGQRVYLGAASLGLGCCGIGAFYDSEAASLLELNSDSSMVYLLSVGTVKKNYFA